MMYPKRDIWKSNTVDPNQTPRSLASDLGIHGLFRPIYILGVNVVSELNQFVALGGHSFPVCWVLIATDLCSNLL